MVARNNKDITNNNHNNGINNSKNNKTSRALSPRHGFGGDVGEGETEDDDPQVVDECQRDENRPAVYEAPRRIEGDVAGR